MLHAQQLAVLCHGLATFYPGHDMVGLHFLNLPVGLLPVLLHAVGTDAALALIHLPLHGVTGDGSVSTSAKCIGSRIFSAWRMPALSSTISILPFFEAIVNSIHYACAGVKIRSKYSK